MRATGTRLLNKKAYALDAEFVKWLPSPATDDGAVALVAPYAAAMVEVRYRRDRTRDDDDASDESSSSSEEEDEEEDEAEAKLGTIGGGGAQYASTKRASSSTAARFGPRLRLIVPLPRSRADGGAAAATPSDATLAAAARATASLRRRLYAFLATRTPNMTLAALRDLAATVESDESVPNPGGDPNGALDRLAAQHGVQRIDADPWERRAMWQNLAQLMRRCDGLTLLSELDELVDLHAHAAPQLFESLCKRYGAPPLDAATTLDADPTAWRQEHVLRDRLAAFMRVHDASASVDDLQTLLDLAIRDPRAAFDALRERHSVNAGAVPDMGESFGGGATDSDVVWLRDWLLDAYFVFSVRHDPAVTCAALRARVERHLRSLLAPPIDPDSTALAGRAALDAVASRVCRSDELAVLDVTSSPDAAPLVSETALWSLSRVRMRVHSLYRRFKPEKPIEAIDRLVERYAHVPTKLLAAVAQKFGAAVVPPIDPHARTAALVASGVARKAAAAAAAAVASSTQASALALGPPPSPTLIATLEEILDQVSLTPSSAEFPATKRPGIRFAVRRQAMRLGEDVVVLSVFISTCFDDPRAKLNARALLVNVQHLESCTEYELEIPPSTGSFDELTLAFSLRYVNRAGVGSWLDTKLLEQLEFCPLSLIELPRLGLGAQGGQGGSRATSVKPSPIDPFRRERLHRRVAAFFRVHDPTRSLRDVNQLVGLYQAKRPILLRTLCTHYDAAEVTDVEERERVWRRIWSFYRTYDASKTIGMLEDIVARQIENQSKLWAHMCKKYDLDAVPDPEECATLRRRLLCFYRGVSDKAQTIKEVDVLVERYHTQQHLLWKTFRVKYGVVPPHPPLESDDEPSARRRKRLHDWLYALHAKWAPDCTVVAFYKLVAQLLPAVADASQHDELVQDELKLDEEQLELLHDSLAVHPARRADPFDPPFERDEYAIDEVRQRTTSFFRERELRQRTIAEVEEIALRLCGPHDRHPYESEMMHKWGSGTIAAGDESTRTGSHMHDSPLNFVPDPVNARRLRARFTAFYTQYDASKTVGEIDELVVKCTHKTGAMNTLVDQMREMFQIDEPYIPFAPLSDTLPLPSMPIEALEHEAELMRIEKAARLIALTERLEAMLQEIRCGKKVARANNRADAVLLATSFIGREDDLIAHLNDSLGFSEGSIANELRIPRGNTVLSTEGGAALRTARALSPRRTAVDLERELETTYDLAALHPVLQWRIFRQVIEIGRERINVTVFVCASPTRTAKGVRPAAPRPGTIDTVRVVMHDPKSNTQALLLLGASGAPLNAASPTDPLLPRVDVEQLVGNVAETVPSLLRLLRYVPPAHRGGLEPARIEIIGHERASRDGASRSPRNRSPYGSRSPTRSKQRKLHQPSLIERIYHMRGARRRALSNEIRAAAYARYVESCAAQRPRLSRDVCFAEWRRAAALYARRVTIRSIKRKHKKGLVELGFQAWISKTASRLALKDFVRVWTNARVAFSSWHNFSHRLYVRKVHSRAKSLPFAMQLWFLRVGRRRQQRKFIAGIRKQRTTEDEYAVRDQVWIKHCAQKMIMAGVLKDLKRWVAACWFQALVRHNTLHIGTVELRTAKLTLERLRVADGAKLRYIGGRLRFRVLLKSLRLSVRTRDARRRATARLVQDLCRSLCVAPPGDVLCFSIRYAKGALNRAIIAAAEGGVEAAQTDELSSAVVDLDRRIAEATAANERQDALNRRARFHELRQLRAARALQEFARIFVKARVECGVNFAQERRYVARYGAPQRSAFESGDKRTVYAQTLSKTVRRRRRAMELAWVGARGGFVEQRLLATKLVQRWSRSILYEMRSKRDSKMVRNVFRQRVVTPPPVDNGPKRCPLGAKCPMMMLGTCTLYHPLEEIDTAMNLRAMEELSSLGGK